MKRILNMFLFYGRATLRNRVRAMLGRLKKPRYIIGTTLVLLYFGWFVFRPLIRLGAHPTGQGSGALGGWGDMVLPGFLCLSCLAPWALSFFFGRGIAFKESETTILFPAPLGRRHLLLFKWWQVQAGMIFTCGLLAVLFVRAPSFRLLSVFLGAYVAFSGSYFSAQLAHLVNAHGKDHGGLARKVGAFMMALVVVGCGGVFLDALLGASDAGSFFERFKVLRDHQGIATLLVPFYWLSAPITATGVVEFLLALPVALGLVGGLVFLNLAPRFSFQERALGLASRISAFKSEGWSAWSSKKKAKAQSHDRRSMLRLASTGPKWRAFVWKNIVSLGRINLRMLAIGVVSGMVYLTLMVSLSNSSGDNSNIAAIVVCALAGLTAFMGPAVVRVDLRIDILHFDVLKSMPIRGRSLIFGEVAGSTLILVVLEAFLVVLGAILLASTKEEPISVIDKLVFVPSILMAVTGVLFLLVTTENILVLFMPGYVRIGRGFKQGIDQFGQNLIGMIIRMFGYLLLMVIPILVGALAGGLGHYMGGPLLAAPLAGLATLVTTVLEALGLIVLAERRYETYDITDEFLSAS